MKVPKLAVVCVSSDPEYMIFTFSFGKFSFWGWCGVRSRAARKEGRSERGAGGFAGDGVGLEGSGGLLRGRTGAERRGRVEGEGVEEIWRDGVVRDVGEWVGEGLDDAGSGLN